MNFTRISIIIPLKFQTGSFLQTNKIRLQSQSMEMGKLYRCPVKNDIQLKMCILESVSNKYKQSLHGCKNILLVFIWKYLLTKYLGTFDYNLIGN